jgi:hypothetical protein
VSPRDTFSDNFIHISYKDKAWNKDKKNVVNFLRKLQRKRETEDNTGYCLETAKQHEEKLDV